MTENGGTRPAKRTPFARSSYTVRHPQSETNRKPGSMLFLVCPSVGVVTSSLNVKPKTAAIIAICERLVALSME